MLTWNVLDVCDWLSVHQPELHELRLEQFVVLREADITVAWCGGTHVDVLLVLFIDNTDETGDREAHVRVLACIVCHECAMVRPTNLKRRPAHQARTSSLHSAGSLIAQLLEDFLEGLHVSLHDSLLHVFSSDDSPRSA